ncbi:hypothetical protein C8F01DRAFT_971892 [Mycena amicta]|nr:hypothetical protein C8F01DRAFT_971892 [Mycena amicta]
MNAALAFLGTPVHRVLFPYVWGTSLHAARISLVFNANLRATQSQLSLGANLIGFLLMCWGGSIGAHILLSLPPPQLYVLGPWINYSAVHLLLSLVFHYVPIVHPALTNTLLFPLDGLLRANSVLHTLSLLNLPTINPLFAASPLFHFILGATASAGGGLLGGTLSVWTQNWQFSTPPPLRTGVWGLWSTLDIWAGGVVATTYGILTAHPAFGAVLSVETTVPTARALSAAVMVGLFGLRVLASARTTPRSEKSGQKEKTE